MDAAMDAAWPLFTLRLRSEHLVLRLPTDDDLVGMLALAKAGIHPPGEMPFGVAWSTVPSPEFERSFMQHHWAMRSSWSAAHWVLNLMTELDGSPIGTQTIEATDFAVFRTVGTGSWIGRAFQGRGFGKEMRAAVLGFSFDGLGPGSPRRTRSSTTPPRTASRARWATRRTGVGSSRRKASRARPSASGWRWRAGARGRAVR